MPNSLAAYQDRGQVALSYYSGGILDNEAGLIPSLWWWHENIFETTLALGLDNDCGELYFFGPAYVPLVLPSIPYCEQNTAETAWGGKYSVCTCRATGSHTGGCNIAMGDSSVRFLAQGISGATWFAACTPNSGDMLGPDW